ncbi:hypothetical protein ANANG_G00306500, partial [Anguilla anguilla]
VGERPPAAAVLPDLLHPADVAPLVVLGHAQDLQPEGPALVLLLLLRQPQLGLGEAPRVVPVELALPHVQLDDQVLLRPLLAGVQPAHHQQAAGPLPLGHSAGQGDVRPLRAHDDRPRGHRHVQGRADFWGDKAAISRAGLSTATGAAGFKSST